MQRVDKRRFAMGEDARSFSVSEIMDKFGINKFTWIMFVLLGFAMIFDGYDYMIMSYTLNDAANSLGVGDNAVLKGSMSSWSTLGLVVGGVVSGVISDRFGRKKTLVTAIFIYALLTLPQAFAPSFEVFVFFRFCAGIGLGACIPTVTTCFTESTPTKYRAIFITLGMAFMILGWVLAGVAGNLITNHPTQFIEGFENWRICFIIGAVPLLYSFLLHFVMHETPHWLASKGRKEEAMNRLSEIEKTGKGSMEITKSLNVDSLVVPPKPKSTSPLALFGKKYIFATCAVWSGYFLGQIVVFGLNLWLPTMMTSVTGDPVTGAGLATWQNGAAVLANATCGFISEKVGRKRSLLLGWTTALIVIILVSVGINNYSAIGYVGTLCLMILLGYAVNYTITCVQPMMAESYPTEFRNTGVAWAQAFGRFGGAMAPMMLGAVLSAFALSAGVDLAAGGTDLVPVYSKALLTLCVPCVLGFICTMVFVRREYAGRSLDELAEEIAD